MAKKPKPKKQETQPAPPPPPQAAAPKPAPPPPAPSIPSSPAPPPAPSPVPSPKPPVTSIPPSPHGYGAPIPNPGPTSYSLPVPGGHDKPSSFLASPGIGTIAEEEEGDYDHDGVFIRSNTNSERGDHPPSANLLYEPPSEAQSPYQDNWALNDESPQPEYDDHNATGNDARDNQRWETQSPNMGPPPPHEPPQQTQSHFDRFGPTDEVAAAAARLAGARTVKASQAARSHARDSSRSSVAGWEDAASIHTTSAQAVNAPAQWGAHEPVSNWRPTIGTATWEETAARMARGAKPEAQGARASGGWGQPASSAGGWGDGGGGGGWTQAAAAQPDPMAGVPGAWRAWGRPQGAPAPAPPPAAPPPATRSNPRARDSAWGHQPQSAWQQAPDPRRAHHAATHAAAPAAARTDARARDSAWGQPPANQAAWQAAGGRWDEEEYDDEDDYEDEEYEEEEQWGQHGAHGRGHQAPGWGAQPHPGQAAGRGGQGHNQNPKVTFAGTESAGSRNTLSPHQRSQILNSLLNQSTQNNYIAQNAAWGAGGDQGYHPAKAANETKDKRRKDKRHSQHSGRKDDGGGDWGNAQGGDWGNGDGGWGGNAGGGGWNEQGGGGGGGGGSGWGQGGGDAGWGAPAGAGSLNGDAAWGDGGGGKPNKKEKRKHGKGGGQEKPKHDGAWAPASAWGQPDPGGAWGQEGGGQGGWDDNWGGTSRAGEDEDEDMEGDRRVHFSPPSTSATSWGATRVGSGYSMPSKTMMHAYNGTSTTLTTGVPPSDLYNYPNFAFSDSKGEALAPVQAALFGKKRYAKDRIHWMFPPDKDERVVQVLAWIQKMSYNLGTYGLHRFLQSRERGALIVNAAYRSPTSPNEPSFDWLTFDELQATMDKTIQTSAAFYDPSIQVIVFVFLPSKSGNSVAMWRRKIRVPNNTRLSLQPEINMAMAGLRKEKDYHIHVDEVPPNPKEVKKAESAPAPPEKPKKKVRWWNPFEW
ncbi:hypothetical protein PLEOSDRAFT_1112085 [Pleurotus ostreatus PC15]|uniref:CcmS related domain-containing protein n=1 Tax=Pleurotus ostreatus (strain PC15) TaxID=1137138 RepID=A0A067NY42_PLEO1|nr:hypothetical protein PLEOSDRAFT_1112085 [Pleurotus ostreatus PC15]